MITATYLHGQIKEFRSAAYVLRWLTENTQQHGWRRTVEGYHLTAPEGHGDYWLRERTWLRLSKEDYARVYRVHQRYRTYCRHMTEVDPEWEDGQQIHWADNSIETIQESRKYPGLTRRVQLVPPHGDACY
jgi:hypothetical protein